MSLDALQGMARSNRGADGAEALPGLGDTTDVLARELTESRERLERELAGPARAPAMSAAERTAWMSERDTVYGVPGPQIPPTPAPEPAPAGAGQPLIRLREGRTMTLGDQTKALAGQTWRQVRRNIREMRKHPGGMINGWLASPGPSVDEQTAYKREKRWVPIGHDDGVADKAGTLFHTVIGIPGVAFFGACKAIVARPFRFGSTFLACYLLTAFTLIIVQPRIVGVAMLIGLPIAVIAALIGLEGWVAAERRAKQPPRPAADEDEDDEDDADPAGYEPPSNTEG